MYNFKNEFSYDDILSPSEVKEKGIFYDDDRFIYESYWKNGFNHYERLPESAKHTPATS